MSTTVHHINWVYDRIKITPISSERTIYPALQAPVYGAYALFEAVKLECRAYWRIPQLTS